MTPLRRIEHPKGDILHVLKRTAPGFAGFGEAYFSSVLAGEVKGWKRHQRVTLNIVVPVGRIRFTLHDRRTGSATEGRFEAITLGPDNNARLTIPPGIWMAFAGAHADDFAGCQIEADRDALFLPGDRAKETQAKLLGLGHGWRRWRHAGDHGGEDGGRYVVVGWSGARSSLPWHA